MVIMQHSGTNLLASSPHLRIITSSAPIWTRLELPSRDVTAETIEDAFVQFILACNPGVPIDAETAALRESFRTPPKSGGKSFETWALFELIAQFQRKEIKTWGELALKLGVEPPNQEKGQSSQKIQQYAVRLKRWMHSMHVDAFFEYLLDNPHPYWTEIPSDQNPVREEGRDGVAAEDDMALRSLLPHIRPRRGRKRPDDESLSSSKSPTQKPRIELGSEQTTASADQQQVDLWAAAQSDARDGSGGAYPFAQDPFSRMNISLGPWTGDDFAHTPMTAHPYSSGTPVTAGGYWPEQQSETKAGVTPPKSKSNRRHGAKVVSSAWRSGGPGGSGKTRGRPPLSQKASQADSKQGEAVAAATSSFSTFAMAQSTSPTPPGLFGHTTLQPSPQGLTASLQQQQHPMMTMGMNEAAATIPSGPHRQQGLGSLQQQGYDVTGQQHTHGAQSQNLNMTRSRSSLQVPHRTGTEVCIATPLGHQVSPGMVSAADAHASMVAQHHHQQHNMKYDMISADVQRMLDPFVAEAAQSMYDLSFQHQVHQYHHNQHHHHHHQQEQEQQPTQHIQHIPQTSHDTVSLYSTTTTASTHHTHDHRRIFQHPTPARNSESTTTTTTTTNANSPLAPAPGTVGSNLAALEAQLTYELLGALWLTPHNIPTRTGSVDEATALAREILSRVRREASGAPQGVLMNVAAIAGLAAVKAPGSRARVRRMGGDEGGGGGSGHGHGQMMYEVHWDLEVGGVRSSFGLKGLVAREADAEGEEEEREGGGGGGEGEGCEGEAAAVAWRERYHGLLDVVQEQSAEVSGVWQEVGELCRPRMMSRDDARDEDMG